jgi:putative peptidoglycan lipid II flippase
MTKLALASLAAIQLLAQFVLQLIILRLDGAGVASDAYVASLTMPMMLAAVFTLSLQNVWQPRLAVLAANEGEWRDAQAVAQGQVLILFVTVVTITSLTANLWVGALFPGFSPQQVELTSHMTRIMLVGALFNAHGALFTTAQRARDRFISAEIVPIVGSLAAIAAVALTLENVGIEAAAWISLLRSVAVAAALFALAGFPGINIRGGWRSDMWSKLYPLLAGSSVIKTGPLIDRFWVSQVPAGGVTVYNLVQTGMGALASVIDRALTVSTAPRLARLAHAKDFRGMRTLYRRCIWHATLIVIAVPLLLLAMRPLWSTLVVDFLRVPGALADQMWLMCFLLLGYLHVAGCGSIVVTAFYALGDTRTPMKLSVVSFLGGAVIKSIAFVYWGMPGLAAATSVYYLFNLGAASYLFERRIHGDVS